MMRSILPGTVAILVVAGMLGAQTVAPYQGAAPYQTAPQQPQYAPQQAQPLPTPATDAQPLNPQQLEDLVAPIALYPDGLLGQVLAAITYPLEIVDAEQWLQQNRNTPAAQLVEAAKQQSWDPSVQALVAFPDVMDILGHDVRWTTDLGNAFLSQQADVMRAVQNLRLRAQQSGALQSTQQQAVNTQYENGQSAIQIQPTDPQVVYVPVYQPSSVWGPPDYGVYPSLWYPPYWDFGYGIGYAPGIYLGSYYSGLAGFGGWGWGVNWFGRSVYYEPTFFSHYGFRGGYGYSGYGGYRGGFGGRSAWEHEPAHRLGVPYASRSVATRFGGNFAQGGRIEGNRVAGGGRLGSGSAVQGNATRGFAGGGSARAQAGGEWRGVGSNPRGSGGNSFAARPAAPQSNAFRGGESASRGFSAPQARSFAQPQARSAQPQARSFSQPQGQSFSQPQARSFSQPQARSFSQPQGQSFSQPQARSFSQPQARSFSQPQSRSFSQPQARSFSQPQARSFSQPQARSFSQPQARSFSQPQQHAAAPRQSAPAQQSSGPRSSGGGGSRAGGGNSGGRRR